jgi:hypothetical protein
MFIPCEISRDCWCKTPCPFGELFAHSVKMVGSWPCQGCQYYVKTTCDKKFVLCNQKGEDNGQNM